MPVLGMAERIAHNAVYVNRVKIIPRASAGLVLAHVRPLMSDSTHKHQPKVVRKICLPSRGYSALSG